MSYNLEAPESITISTTGRYYVQSIGAVSIQILTAAGGLSFTVEGVNVNPGTVFSQIDYGLNGVLQGIGTACTPSAGDVVDIPTGGFNFAVINVSAGTGTAQSTTRNGLKVLS